MIISDLLLNWMHEDGYSLGESGWMNPTYEVQIAVAIQMTRQEDGNHGETGGVP